MRNFRDRRYVYKAKTEDAFTHQQRLLAAKRMAAGSADPAELIEAQDMVVLYGGTTLRRRAVRQVHYRPGLRRRQRLHDGQVRRRHQQVLTPSDTCADVAKGVTEWMSIAVARSESASACRARSPRSARTATLFELFGVEDQLMLVGRLEWANPFFTRPTAR